MKAIAAALVTAALVMTTAACSSSDDNETAPEPTTPATSTTGATTAPTSDPTSSAPAPTDPPDVDTDGDGFEADDGVFALSTQAHGTPCLFSDNADYGWIDAKWKSHTDLEAVEFRLEGATGVKVVGDVTTVPPINFGGRIDYGGMLDWADKSPLVNDNFIYWPDREDTAFLSPLEDQTGLLLFHLRFDKDTVAGKQQASLGDLVAEYTKLDGTAGSVTLASAQGYGFGKNC